MQNRNLEVYNAEIKPVVLQFLSHFSGHMTFHLRPEMVVSQGAPTTVLLSQGHVFKNYHPLGYRITDVMAAMSAQEVHDIAEVALSSFEEFKGPLDTKTALMKSIGLHPKDLAAAAVYLVYSLRPDPLPQYPGSGRLDWMESRCNGFLERTKGRVNQESNPQ